MLSLICARRLIISANRFYKIPTFVQCNLKNVHAESRFKINTKNPQISRSLTTSSAIFSSNFDKVCSDFTNLDKNYKQQQRIYKHDIESLIENVKNEGLLNEENSLLLLQCCGHLMPDILPAKRIALAEQAWQTFLTKNISLSVRHYNALLKCCAENQTQFSYKDFLTTMTCEPNKLTYSLLLECACEVGDIPQAVDIVNTMKEKGLSLNEPDFNSMILGHLRCRDIKSAKNILETMRIAQIRLSSRTYTALLRGYVEMDNIKQFTNILQTAPINDFNLKQISMILQSVCISNNIELLPLIKEVWSTRIDWSRSFETKVVNLCVHLIHLQKPEIAYELFKCLVDPEVGFVTESDTYGAILFHEMILANTSSEIIIKIADDLIKTDRNSFALFKATEIALKATNVQLSLVLLQEMFDRKIKLKNHFFWPILVHEARLHGETGIFDIFKIMLSYDLKIDSETLEMYSLQYIQNIDPDILIERLKEFKLTVKDILTPLCIVLLRSGQLKVVGELGLKYKVKFDAGKLIKPLVAICATSNDLNSTVDIVKLLQTANQTEDWAGQLISLMFTRSIKNVNHQQIYELLELYKSNEISLSGPYFDKLSYFIKHVREKDTRVKLQDVLNSLNTFNGLDNKEYIPHPRDMNIEELECHLLELRSKKMETRGVLRKLLQLHCRAGNVERVTQLCQVLKDLQFMMTPGMKSSLLDVYIKSEQLYKAWELYNDIKTNNASFAVDEFKVIDLAKLLKKNDRFDDALQILKCESSHNKIRGGHNIERNCWNLLDFIAKTGNITETNTMFKTLVSCGYCTESNIILGPLIRVHLCNDDINGAVEEYVSCCKKYNKTPLVHELFCNLVKTESNTDLIQKVLEGTTSVHGIANGQISLMAALAETGLTKTLHKLLLETQLQLSPTLLGNYCERWIHEGKIHALQNLISCSRGINTTDFSIVYYNLMRYYSANNDCDNALLLWNDMQDNDIIPPQHIKNLMSSLLNSQKHPMANNF